MVFVAHFRDPQILPQLVGYQTIETVIAFPEIDRTAVGIDGELPGAADHPSCRSKSTTASRPNPSIRMPLGSVRLTPVGEPDVSLG